MKRLLMLGVVGLAGLGLAAGPDAKDDVKNAAKKLGEQGYSWVSTPKTDGGGGGGGGGAGAQARQQGPTEGKIDKDGTALITQKRGEQTSEAAVKGTKVVVKTADGWKSAEEFGQPQAGQRPDPASFLARSLRTFKAPHVQAAEIADKTAELKTVGDAIAGNLTEQGAKDLLSFGGRPGGGGQAPEIANPKGSVKYWIKDGALAKYEYTVSGTMSFGGQDRAINRTVTIDIKDVGKTTVSLPEDAKKKL